MFRPTPKPEKREKNKMTAYEFRKKYGNKKIVAVNNKPKPPYKKKIYNTTAWKWFSRYIKLLYSDKQGMVRCQTSGRLMSVSSRNLHCGHCIKVYDGNSTNMNVALDERNCMPQSYQDNRYFGGRPEVMVRLIDQKHGKGTYEELLNLSKTPKFYTNSELKEIAYKYRIKTYELLNEKGIEKWWIKKNC